MTPWFDIQVNGYAGVDFNQDDLGADDLHLLCERLEADGAGGILAAIITEAPDRMERRLRRIVSLREADPLARRIIAGIHIEGPFLNPREGYRGAHPADAMCRAERSLAGRLLDAAGGLTRIFTLAPEQDPGCDATRFIAERGVVVSAGHTDASLDQLRAAIDAGLTMATHLGNGCPATLPRHDNIIQRVLFLRECLWLCFIADGIHIPFPTLKNFLDLAGPAGKCLVTTDAMAAAGRGPGRYRIGRWDVQVGEDLAVRSVEGGHFIGSAVPMPLAAENLACHLGLSPETIDALVCSRPREAVGLA